MPRKTQHIVDVKSNQLIPLDEIPQDVKDFAEEVYAWQRKTSGRERVTYDNDQERELESRQLASYAAQRPQGVLKYTRSPSKGLPPHAMDFRLSADVEANGNRNAGNDRRQPVGQK